VYVGRDCVSGITRPFQHADAPAIDLDRWAAVPGFRFESIWSRSLRPMLDAIRFTRVRAAPHIATELRVRLNARMGAARRIVELPHERFHQGSQQSRCHVAAPLMRESVKRECFQHHVR